MTYSLTIKVKDDTANWLVGYLSGVQKRRKIKTMTPAMEAKIVGNLVDNLIEAYVMGKK